MGLLGNMLGGGSPFGMGRPGRMSPLTIALLGTLAYRTFQGKGRLADMLRGNSATQQPGASSGGGLGGLLTGGALSGGISDLFKRFQDAGHGDKAASWVSPTETNRPLAPPDLESTLGEDRIQWLMQETGMSRDELLAGLSKTLPETIDKLTPNGHLPSEEEAKHLI